MQQWLEARALTVVPVAAKELLDGAVDTRQELDSARAQLWDLARRESDTPLGDLMRLRDHDALLLLEVHRRADELIVRLRTNQPADDQYRAWRQAVGRYDRSST